MFRIVWCSLESGASFKKGANKLRCYRTFFYYAGNCRPAYLISSQNLDKLQKK